jgi:hypothetical protein
MEAENSKKKLWLKRLGIAGFLFFLIKGIGWLVLAGLVAAGLWK